MSRRGVSFKISRKLKDILNGKIIKDITSSQNLDRLGKEAKDIIYKRVKSGFGVASDDATLPQKKKLKALSPKYIKYRRKNPPTGELATAKKSNLTYTGQMLNSLTYKLIKDGVKVELKGQHKSGISNKLLGEYVSRQGRSFLNITKSEAKLLLRKIKDIMRDVVSRY